MPSLALVRPPRSHARRSGAHAPHATDTDTNTAIDIDTDTDTADLDTFGDIRGLVAGAR